MKNILLILLLLVGANSAYAQSVKSNTDAAILREIESVSPRRAWVQGIGNSTWYYGYYADGVFKYTRSYKSGLSDFSQMYGVNLNGNSPKIPVKYESYNEQFNTAVNRLNKRVETSRSVPPTRSNKGFNWIDEKPRRKTFKPFGCKCGLGCECKGVCGCE